MSNYDINANPALVKQIIENTKKAYEEYLAEHPDSLIRHLNRNFAIADFNSRYLNK